MVRRNRIKEILQEAGLRKFSPTPALLKRLSMSPKRFGQLLNNSAKSEITVREKEAIEKWLKEAFCRDVDIMEQANNHHNNG